MSKKIGEIKEEFQAAAINMLPELISAYMQDERTGVQQLVKKAELQLEALEQEKKRSYEMFRYERQYSNYQAICGIDEVGRGPLAGPVVACAVILTKDCDIL